MLRLNGADEKTHLLDSIKKTNALSCQQFARDTLLPTLRVPMDYLTVIGIHGFAMVLTNLNPSTEKFDADIIQNLQLPLSVSLAATSLFLPHVDKLPNDTLRKIVSVAAGLYYELFQTASTTAFGILTLTQIEGTIFGLLANFKPDYVSNASYYPPFAISCLASLCITLMQALMTYPQKDPQHLQALKKILTENHSNVLNKTKDFAGIFANKPWLRIAVNSFLFTTTLYSLPITFSIPFNNTPSLKENIILTGLGLLLAVPIATRAAVAHQKHPTSQKFIDKGIKAFNIVNWLTLTWIFYLQLNQDKEVSMPLLVSNIAFLLILTIAAGLLTSLVKSHNTKPPINSLSEYDDDSSSVIAVRGDHEEDALLEAATNSPTASKPFCCGFFWTPTPRRDLPQEYTSPQAGITARRPK